MSRKHYQRIAEILKKFTSDNDIYKGRVDAIVRDIADYMQEDNPNFDRNRFFKACYS